MILCAHVCSGSFRKEMVSEAVSCKALQWREEWVAFLHFSALECSAMLSCYQPAGGLDTIGSPTTSCLCRLPSSSVNLSFTAHFHSAHSFSMELSLYCKTCCEQTPFTLTHFERQPPAQTDHVIRLRLQLIIPAHKKSSRMG